MKTLMGNPSCPCTSMQGYRYSYEGNASSGITHGVEAVSLLHTFSPKRKQFFLKNLRLGNNEKQDPLKIMNEKLAGGVCSLRRKMWTVHLVSHSHLHGGN
ncbi:hypothetical protein POVCU2_0049150 [Plasmodium ovale curtisi]|uniref:Uncharacterized protein n=1 Tax=Plasmodium ovale curtisi TaxID=864141 RepID=A0A1A8WBH6_PLAOA|nr:hypothetical protein POVCU2_0049150 [Plasmodium ovale curtisi]SBS98356.1 hypothetical protein POVCU1_045510 [Plasmodium ovale curtisi]